ncbi:hypothetical protein FRB90_012385 [Tulasnella sp. 427]|nr:hypothetical protein FRB90_012385 [Tulasnella sp. 427]
MNELSADEIKEIRLSLARTNTYNRPLGDPGVHLKLKWSDSAEDCVLKFQPYVAWLGDYVQANTWIPPQILVQFQESDYTALERDHVNISAMRELFSRKTHKTVLTLWGTYRAIRKWIDDKGTTRRTVKAADIQTRIANELIRAQSSAAEATLEIDSFADPMPVNMEEGCQSQAGPSHIVMASA